MTLNDVNGANGTARSIQGIVDAPVRAQGPISLSSSSESAQLLQTFVPTGQGHHPAKPVTPVTRPFNETIFWKGSALPVSRH